MELSDSRMERPVRRKHRTSDYPHDSPIRQLSDVSNPDATSLLTMAATIPPAIAAHHAGKEPNVSSNLVTVRTAITFTVAAPHDAHILSSPIRWDGQPSLSNLSAVSTAIALAVPASDDENVWKTLYERQCVFGDCSLHKPR